MPMSEEQKRKLAEGRERKKAERQNSAPDASTEADEQSSVRSRLSSRSRALKAKCADCMGFTLKDKCTSIHCPLHSFSPYAAGKDSSNWFILDTSEWRYIADLLIGQKKGTSLDDLVKLGLLNLVEGSYSVSADTKALIDRRLSGALTREREATKEATKKASESQPATNTTSVKRILPDWA